MALANEWYALQIRPRFEEMSRRILTGKGYETLLPCYVNQTAKGTQSEKPLFPGYLFCRLNAEADGLIVSTPGVTRVVGFGRRWTPLEPHEVANLQRISQTTVPCGPWPYLAQGTHVRIGSGPLRGVEGVLASDTSGNKVVVSVTLLQRSMAVSVDSSVVLTAQSSHRLPEETLTGYHYQ